MKIRLFVILIAFVFIAHITADCQYIEKVTFDNKDSTGGYYLAVHPRSENIKGTLVLLSNFYGLDGIISETKLHNVAYAYGNDVLTIFASMKEKLYADTTTVNRINTILKNVVARFSPDTSKFAIAGFDYAGIIALRYTELTYQFPTEFLIHPKAVFAIDSPVDLFGLWHLCEREIKKNYSPENAGDAKYILDAMTKENGTIYNSHETYSKLSPFDRERQTTGNEQYLKNVAVRLYYDTDIDWQLKNKRNSFYDTNIPDGSELINQLLLLGNDNAEFVSSKQPGMRSNGIRNPTSLSIVNEVECIQWLKQKLDIFDADTWQPPYNLSIPNGWNVERFSLPPDFAPQITYKGIEDLRFTPGWEDTLSEEHWSYAYLWWLEGNPKINEVILQENLKAYYSGLIGRNIPRRNIPSNKIVPTNVIIKKVKTASNDMETYSGTINMLDYIAQRPIALNCLVHIKSCKTQNRTGVLFEISPKSFGHSIWKEFDNIEATFDCKK
jgi:hypothetical protein